MPMEAVFMDMTQRITGHTSDETLPDLILKRHGFNRQRTLDSSPSLQELLLSCMRVLLLSNTCLFGASCGGYRTNGRLNHLTCLPEKGNRHSLSQWTHFTLPDNQPWSFRSGFAFSVQRIEETPKHHRSRTRIPERTTHYARISPFFLLSIQHHRLCSLSLCSYSQRDWDTREMLHQYRHRSLAQHQGTRTPFSLSSFIWNQLCVDHSSACLDFHLDNQWTLDYSTISEHVLGFLMLLYQTESCEDDASDFHFHWTFDPLGLYAGLFLLFLPSRTWSPIWTVWTCLDIFLLFFSFFYCTIGSMDLDGDSPEILCFGSSVGPYSCSHLLNPQCMD